MRRMAREDGARRDPAEEIARALLAKVKFGAVLDYEEGVLAALEDIQEELEKRLKDSVLEAFRVGKQAAYELVAQAPPVGKAKRAPAGMNNAELELFEERYLEPWRLRLEGEHREFEVKLTAAIAAQREAGISGEAVRKTIERDWQQRGRLTSAWQRAMVAAANALIGAADGAGQECGYMGTGQ